MKSSGMGLSLAMAIALHNIPEGVAVALPIFFATGSRWEGFKYALLSGPTMPHCPFEPFGTLGAALLSVSHQCTRSRGDGPLLRRCFYLEAREAL
jgi:zinc transporter ZupT